MVDERGLRRLATTEHPQSPVAVMVIPAGCAASAGHLLVAWGVGDPGNVGTLIRCAAAFGLGFAAGPGTADPWAPKVLRAAAGGHFRAGVARVEALEALRAGGRRLVATVARGGLPPAACPRGLWPSWWATRPGACRPRWWRPATWRSPSPCRGARRA